MKKAFMNLVFLALISIQYNVASGDTLQSIAEQFCHTENKTEFAEFKEGIRQINYDLIGNGDVKTGMVITINQFK